jgi:hypothetical protein
VVRIHSPRPTKPLESLVFAAVEATGRFSRFLITMPKTMPGFCPLGTFEGGKHCLGLRMHVSAWSWKNRYGRQGTPGVWVHHLGPTRQARMTERAQRNSPR